MRLSSVNTYPQSGHSNEANGTIDWHFGQFLTRTGARWVIKANPMHGESVNRAVPLDIAGEVQDKTVGLAGSGADSSANLLNVVARGHRRTKHSNEIHFGNIEPDGKHIDSKLGAHPYAIHFRYAPRFENIDGVCSLIESSSEHAAICRLS